MDKRTGSHVRWLAVRTLLAVVIFAGALAMAGCGEKMAKLEQSQLRLQQTTQANAEQLSALVTRIERDQRKLQSAIEAVRSDTRQVAAEVATVKVEQTKLQEALQRNAAQFAATTDALGQEHSRLQARITHLQSDAEAIVADVATLQNNQATLQEVTQKNNQQILAAAAVTETNYKKLRTSMDNVQSDAQKVAARLVDLDKRRAEWQKTMRSNNDKLVRRLAAIEQQRSEWLAQVENLQAQVQTLTEGLSASDQSMQQLQETIQNHVNQANTELQAEIESRLQGMSDSISAITQAQTELQSQVAKIQSSVQAYKSEMRGALEQSKQEPPDPAAVELVGPAKLEPPDAVEVAPN